MSLRECMSSLVDDLAYSSHAMGRKVSYNFLIGDDGSGHPSSSRDVSGQVADLEDVGESLHHAHGPDKGP